MAAQQKPQQNPRLPRRITPCHRHPQIPTTTGLCAPCLHERLSLLNPSATATVAGAPPELRRCKTFSAKNREISFEPRRRSCDVRARNTLSTLFNIDDDDGEQPPLMKVESRNLGFLSKGTCPVLEVEEQEVEDSDCDIEVARVSNLGINDNVIDGFEVARVSNLDEFGECNKTMKEFIDLELETKNSKGSNNNNRKDFKEIAGSLFGAASVFSKKVRKWRKKGTNRRDDEDDGNVNSSSGCNGADGNGVHLGEMRLERLRGRRLRDTQSEVGEYGFGGRRSCDTDPRGSIDYGRASIDCGGLGRGSIDGLGRRSCDSDPRFSIDLGRASVDCGSMSIDEGRCSIDAPRASWDGYLIGGRGLPPRGNAAPMVSVIENAMATVYGFDHRVLAEGKTKVENGDKRDMGGSKHMKDRLLDTGSLERGRMSLDSSLSRGMLVTDNGEAKSLSNARVSPAAIGIFNGTKLLITEKELNEWRLNSVRDDSSESFETASKDFGSVTSSSNGQGFKKCRQWSKLWSIWGLLHRKKGDKYGDEEKVERGNAEYPRTDSAGSSARNGNAQAGFDPDWKLARSHSTTSSRGSNTVVGPVREPLSRSESKAIVRRRQEDVVLDRSRSSRFSPNHLDNGLLRFYLTPLRSRRRSKLGKSRLKNSRSLARSVLRL